MARRTATVVGLLSGAMALLLLVGCANTSQDRTDEPVAAPSPSPPAASPSPGTSPGTSPGPTDQETSQSRSQERVEPRRSVLSIPALGLSSISVIRYVGSPDDAEGTRIQNAGPTASPRGPGGGVGPGEIGNFIVTGHRTSHTEPFRNLPELENGDRVRVRSGSVAYVYRIVATRQTSFRSPRSLAEQAAAVPGRPGVTPTRAMITLSTCATPEDHAAGNFWSDEFGNPEHRIDKVGVLVETIRLTG